MIRQVVAATSALSITQDVLQPRQLSRSISTRVTGDGKSPAEQWLESLKRNSEAIPSALTDFKFSKSSGAGGQNVNKFNTKVTGYTSLEAIQKLAPPDIRREITEKIKSHKYYAHGADAMVIHSEEHRRQNENRRAVIEKRNSVLHNIVAEIIAKQASKGPPKQLPKSPPLKLNTRDARDRFMAQKRERKKKEAAASIEKRLREEEEIKTRDPMYRR